MTESVCTLDEEETKRMLFLHGRAQNTPMIKMTSDPKEKDFSTLAWDDVREFQIEMGKKHNYDWEKVMVNKENGKVFRMEDVKNVSG